MIWSNLENFTQFHLNRWSVSPGKGAGGGKGGGENPLSRRRRLKKIIIAAEFTYIQLRIMRWLQVWKAIIVSIMKAVPPHYYGKYHYRAERNYRLSWGNIIPRRMLVVTKSIIWTSGAAAAITSAVHEHRTNAR